MAETHSVNTHRSNSGAVLISHVLRKRKAVCPPLTTAGETIESQRETSTDLDNEHDKHDEETRKKAKKAGIMGMAPAYKKRIKPGEPHDRHELGRNAKIGMPTGGTIALSDAIPSTQPPQNVPDWYSDTSVRPRDFRSETITLRRVRTITTILASATGPQKRETAAELRGFLLQMSLMDFHGKEKGIIKKSALLTDGTFDSIARAAPPDIATIATRLRDRWWSGDTDPDLLRGIKRNKATSAKNHTHVFYSLDPTYAFRESPNYVGAGKLYNGQWWPLQICANRDGAHGEIEAGIAGLKAQGAFSVVVAGGGYADVDDGEVIHYCGTPSPSADGKKVSMSTQLMLTAMDNKTPVRVLRSAKIPKSKFRPVRGLRYDGLYDINGAEVVDSTVMLYRFRLERQAGQGEITWRGEGKRPHAVELEALRKDEEVRRFVVS